MYKVFMNKDGEKAAIMNVNGFWCVVVDGSIRLSFDYYRYYDSVVAIKNLGYHEEV